jgi:hypothetical protein
MNCKQSKKELIGLPSSMIVLPQKYLIPSVSTTSSTSFSLSGMVDWLSSFMRSSSTDAQTIQDLEKSLDWDKPFIVPRNDYTMMSTYVHDNVHYALLSGPHKTTLYNITDQKIHFENRTQYEEEFGSAFISPDNKSIVQEVHLDKKPPIIHLIDMSTHKVIETPFGFHRNFMQVNPEKTFFIVSGERSISFYKLDGSGCHFDHTFDQSIFLLRSLADSRYLVAGTMGFSGWAKYFIFGVDGKYDGELLGYKEFCHVVGFFDNSIVLWRDGNIEVYHVPSKRILYQTPHDDEACIQGLAEWKPDGSMFMLRTARDVYVHKIDTHQCLVLPLEETWGAVHFGPENDYIAIVQKYNDEHDLLHFYSTIDGKELGKFEIPAESRIRSPLSKSRFYAVITMANRLQVFDTKQVISDYKHGGFIDIEGISPYTGAQAFVVRSEKNAYEGHMQSVDREKLKNVLLEATDQQEITKLSEFSHYGNLFVSSTKKTIYITTIASGSHLQEIEQEIDDPMQFLEFSFDDRYFVIAGSHYIKIFDKQQRYNLTVEKRFKSEVIRYARFDKTGRMYMVMTDKNCYFYMAKDQ